MEAKYFHTAMYDLSIRMIQIAERRPTARKTSTVGESYAGGKANVKNCVFSLFL